MSTRIRKPANASGSLSEWSYNYVLDVTKGLTTTWPGG